MPIPDGLQYKPQIYESSNLPFIEKQPYLITGIFLNMFKLLFSNPQYRNLTSLASYVYTDDDTKTIDVIPEYLWDRESAVIPKIVIKRGAINFKKISLGDRSHGATLDGQPIDEFQCAMVGDMTVIVVSTSGQTTEYLGSEVGSFIAGFAPILRDEFNWQKFDLVSTGNLSRLKEDRNQWLVPITIQYAYIDSWQLIPDAGLLMDIKLSLQTD